MKNAYVVLGEILKGEQPGLKDLLEMRFDDGAEIEGTTVYSFLSLRIHEAAEFLRDNWEYLSPVYI